jgi:hypothetical protein
MKLVGIDEAESISVLNQKSVFEKIAKEVDTIINSDRYNFVVDESNIGDVKTIRAELNKYADSVDTIRKNKVKEENVHVKEFEENFKALTKKFKDQYTKLSEGLIVFENKAKEDHKVKLLEYLEILFDENEIREEFRVREVDDYLSTTGLTEKSRELVKSSKDKLEAYVAVVVGNQAKVDLATLKKEKEIQDRVDEKVKEHTEQSHEKELNRVHTPPAPIFPVDTSTSVPDVPEQNSVAVPAEQAEHHFGSVGTSNTVPENVPPVEDGLGLYGVQITYNIVAPKGIPVNAIQKKIHDELVKAGFSDSPESQLEISVVEMS